MPVKLDSEYAIIRCLVETKWDIANAFRDLYTSNKQRMIMKKTFSNNHSVVYMYVSLQNVYFTIKMLCVREADGKILIYYIICFCNNCSNNLSDFLSNPSTSQKYYHFEGMQSTTVRFTHHFLPRTMKLWN